MSWSVTPPLCASHQSDAPASPAGWAGAGSSESDSRRGSRPSRGWLPEGPWTVRRGRSAGWWLQLRSHPKRLGGGGNHYYTAETELQKINIKADREILRKETPPVPTLSSWRSACLRCLQKQTDLGECSGVTGSHRYRTLTQPQTAPTPLSNHTLIQGNSHQSHTAAGGLGTDRHKTHNHTLSVPGTSTAQQQRTDSNLYRH